MSALGRELTVDDRLESAKNRHSVVRGIAWIRQKKRVSSDCIIITYVDRQIYWVVNELNTNRETTLFSILDSADCLIHSVIVS